MTAFLLRSLRRARKSYGLAPDRTTVIPNPVDVESFCPADYGSDVEPLVLFVGPLEWWKGTDVFGKAIRTILVNPVTKFISSRRGWQDGQSC